MYKFFRPLSKIVFQFEKLLVKQKRNILKHIVLKRANNSILSRADPGFFLGGGAPVSCSTSTPINHIVFFFFAEYQLY